MNSSYAKRVVSLGASTVAPVGVALWPRGFLGKKEKKKVCNPEGVQVHEGESCRAKLWLEYFEYGFEHRVRGSGVGTHPVGMSVEAQKGCMERENFKFSV